MGVRKKKTRGRKKGMTLRGPTVPTALRMSKDLHERIQRLRKSTKDGLTFTRMVERLCRKGLTAEEQERALQGRPIR